MDATFRSAKSCLDIFIINFYKSKRMEKQWKQNFCYLVFIAFLLKISQRILTSILILHCSRMKLKQFILFYDLQASPRVENKYSLNETLQKRGSNGITGFQLTLWNTQGRDFCVNTYRVSVFNYYNKKLHLRYLARFLICLFSW